MISLSFTPGLILSDVLPSQNTVWFRRNYGPDDAYCHNSLDDIFPWGYPHAFRRPMQESVEALGEKK